MLLPEMIDWYRTEGKSVEYIAKKSGYSISYIRTLLSQHNIKRSKEFLTKLRRDIVNIRHKSRATKIKSHTNSKGTKQ